MLVVRIGEEIELLVMSCVVIAEPQLLASIHVVIDVEQALYRSFDVHKLPQVWHRRVHKVDLPAQKPLVGAPFIVSYARRLHHRTRVNQVAHLLKIGFNPQTGWLAQRPPSPADALVRRLAKINCPFTPSAEGCNSIRRGTWPA